MTLKGVCCGFCLKLEERACPVLDADPWSLWQNFCSEYVCNDLMRTSGALSFDEAISEQRRPI